MIIRLPHHLPYPVTISSLLVDTNATVKRGQAVVVYTYVMTVVEYPEFGEEVKVGRDMTGRFESPVEGKVKRWFITKGAVVSGPEEALLAIEEMCPHETQYAGLCVACGQDMTREDYTGMDRENRATVAMPHNSNLKVSENEARRLEEEAKRRLLKSKKLSLVVDLDQTIIHATVDPTVKQWQDDPENPNYELVKDVKAFQLQEDVAARSGTFYYVKQRPGLKEFLEHISQLYELHIYTMGTRAYALEIKKIVDPEGTMFGDRVLSRDESGSLTQKSLQRLFPVDTKMVVIIDDRGDVWKWSDNLVRVKPYEFFPRIGDINAGFLPKRPTYTTPPPEMPPPAPPTLLDSPDEVDAKSTETEMKEDEEKPSDTEQEAEPAAETTEADAEANSESQLSTLEKLMTMGTSDSRILTDQKAEFDKALAAQQEERPLAKLQEEQDALDLASEEAEGTTETSDAPVIPTGPRKHHHHSILNANDTELTFLQQHLSNIHAQFYETYEKNIVASRGRISELKRPGARRKAQEDEKDGLNLKAVPDVTSIIPQMKHQCLGGCVLVFSGVIPLGQDIQTDDRSMWAKNFGAVITDAVGSSVTHVIAQKPRTVKVRVAERYPKIKIVSPEWLFACLTNWRREPEEQYLLPVTSDGPAVAGVSDEEIEAELDAENGFHDEDSSTDEDMDAALPEMGVERRGSIADIDWGAVDAEIADFLGEDADMEDSESDAESDTSSVGSRTLSVGRQKRGLSEEESSEDGDAEEGSRLAKRQRVAKERAEMGSTLRSFEGADAAGTSEGDGDGDSLAGDLERELMREFEDLDEEDEREAEREREKKKEKETVDLNASETVDLTRPTEEPLQRTDTPDQQLREEQRRASAAG